LSRKEIAAGTLVQLPNGSLKVSEEVARSLDCGIEAINASEKEIQSDFCTLAAAQALVFDRAELWNDFEILFVKPLVELSGARLYGFATGDSDIDVEIPSFAELAGPLCDK
jgi:hypothetical protein